MLPSLLLLLSSGSMPAVAVRPPIAVVRQDENPMRTLEQAYRSAKYADDRIELLHKLATLAQDDPSLVDRITKTVVRGLEDQELDVRATAAELLPELKQSRAVKALGSVLGDGVKKLRSLGKKLDSDTAFLLVFKTAGRPSKEVEEYNAIVASMEDLHVEQQVYVAALARISDDKSVAYLSAYLDVVPYNKHSYATIDALLGYGTANSIEAVVSSIGGYADELSERRMDATVARLAAAEMELDLEVDESKLTELVEWGANLQNRLGAFASARGLAATPSEPGSPKPWQAWFKTIKKQLPATLRAKKKALAKPK